MLTVGHPRLVSNDSVRPGDSDARLLLADRTHHYRAPVSVLFPALISDLQHWMRLAPGEVLPRVLQSTPMERVVWSSFWPVSPDDTIELELTNEDNAMAAIRLMWFTSTPPDERGIGITRQRLNRKLGGDLRAVVSEHFWNSRSTSVPGNARPSMTQLIAELGIDEIGRRYIAELQYGLERIRHGADGDRDQAPEQVDGIGPIIESAVWGGDDPAGGRLTTDVWWELAMAALRACPPDDSLLWCLGDGPFDNMRENPEIDARLLAARSQDPAIDRLFAAMRRELPSEDVTTGFWFT